MTIRSQVVNIVASREARSFLERLERFVQDAPGMRRGGCRWTSVVDVFDADEGIELLRCV